MGIVLDVDLKTGVAEVAPECADAIVREKGGRGGGLSALENACAAAMGATEKRKKKKFVCQEPEIELRIKDDCGESEVNVELEILGRVAEGLNVDVEPKEAASDVKILKPQDEPCGCEDPIVIHMNIDAEGRPTLNPKPPQPVKPGLIESCCQAILESPKPKKKDGRKQSHGQKDNLIDSCCQSILETSKCSECDKCSID